MITADLEGRVNQLSPETLSAGDKEKLRVSNIGQLWTAGWHERLIAAGRAFTLDLGDLGTNAWTALAGIAAMDLDRPEIVLAQDLGETLIPMEIEIDIVVDAMTAYDDKTQIGFYADRTQATAAGATGTVEVPNNMLDGAKAFTGRAYSIINSADITNPVMSDYLGGANWEITQLATEILGSVPAEKSFKKVFEYPTFLRGPCQIIGHVTGLSSPTFMGAIKFASIPSEWVPIPAS